jgi:glycerol-3-phosphate dehydrogenase (NAD(P)+)
MATCMSPQSRNRYVGEQLGKGRALQNILDEMNMVAEGVKTAAMVQDLSKQYDVDMRVCSTISKVISGEIRADQAFHGLRNAQHEMDED